MVRPHVAVVDYGMGNVRSVMNALNYLGASVELVDDPDQLGHFGFLVLPGVGSFRRGMEALRARHLDQAILASVKTGQSKILGICLGMQLLGIRGSEDGVTEGLGFANQSVDRFTPEEVGDLKVPHVGFNAVNFEDKSLLFKGLPQGADFYFTHSYRMKPVDIEGTIATCEYGTRFLAAFEMNNVFGTQFHPEKSQTNGLMLLSNFLDSPRHA